MFQRISQEDWAGFFPVLAFVVSFTVFTLVTVLALRMNRQRREQLAALPLDDGQAAPRSTKH
jgi:hypothetical protein